MRLGFAGSIGIVLLATAPARAELLVEDLSGDVTQAEIAAFKDHMAGLEPSDNNLGNAYAYGRTGLNVEALGSMYEVTHDAAILVRLLHFTDHMLAGRNDPQTGRMIWTGTRAPCWPNKAEDAADAAYCGTENGDVIGHIAYAAKLIAKTPSLWNVTVPDGDPESYGATYLERAERYVTELNQTIDTFLLPHFVQAGTLRLHWPESPLYGTLGPRADASRGTGVPWNQQAMLGSGFQRLGETLELLNQDAPRAAQYHAIVQAYVDWFEAELQTYQVGGFDCYKWSYTTGDAQLRYMEDTPHGNYDIWGIWAAKQRAAYGVNDGLLEGLANTLKLVIYNGDDFSARVDGSEGRRGSLGSQWLYLAQYDPELLPIVANAGLARQEPDFIARVLWLKRWAAGTLPPDEVTPPGGGMAGSDGMPPTTAGSAPEPPSSGSGGLGGAPGIISPAGGLPAMGGKRSGPFPHTGL